MEKADTSEVRSSSYQCQWHEVYVPAHVQAQVQAYVQAQVQAYVQDQAQAYVQAHVQAHTQMLDYVSDRNVIRVYRKKDWTVEIENGDELHH